MQPPYELIEKLGEGGMGEVWKARDVRSGELVALKFMKLEKMRNDPKAFERVQREIQIAMTLDHPHILRALTYGHRFYQNQRRLYLVSQYISGGSLGHLIDRRPPHEYWTLTQTADAILQAAQALDYLHTRSRPIIHQDVKPDNFLLVHRRQDARRIVHLFLCDFGIARWQITGSEMTSNPIGTRGYMAPEQAYGAITWTADQYSLAMLACELLTGQKPKFDLSMHIHHDIRAAHDTQMYEQRPSVLNPQRKLSYEIDAAILRALAFDPEQRFPSILTFGETLHWVIMRQVGHNVPTHPLPRADTNIFVPTQLAPTAPTEVAFVPIAIRQIEPFGQQVADEASVPEPHQEIPLRPARVKGVSLPSLAVSTSLRKDLPGRPNSISWSPDGEYIACTFYGETPPMIIKHDKSIQTVQGIETTQAACWSPNGHVLAISALSAIEGQSEIHFWNRSVSAFEQLILAFKGDAIHELNWSCRGELAVWVNDHIHIYALPEQVSSVHEPLDPQYTVMQQVQYGGNSVLRWSPDGSLLAVGTKNGTLACWSVDKRMMLPQWDVSTPGQSIYSLAWTPDSTSLAIAFRDKRVAMWNVRAHRKLGEWSKLAIVPRQLSISQQGHISLVSNRARILFGYFDEPTPSAMSSGQWFAVWSPTRAEFATLDAEKDTALVIYQEKNG